MAAPLEWRPSCLTSKIRRWCWEKQRELSWCLKNIMKTWGWFPAQSFRPEHWWKKTSFAFITEQPTLFVVWSRQNYPAFWTPCSEKNKSCKDSASQSMRLERSLNSARILDQAVVKILASL